MAEWGKLNGIEDGVIANVDTIVLASIANINGLTTPSQGFAYNEVQSYSCIFDVNQNTDMAFTPSAAGTEETFTISVWMKKCHTDNGILLNSGTAGTELGVDAFGRPYFTTASANLLWDESFDDTTQWHHLVLGVDTTQATAADRVKLWHNGRLVTDLNPINNDYPDQDEVTDFLKTNAHYLGSDEAGGTHLTASIADFVLIDGSQLDATSFGEFSNGIWIPIDISGLTFGTQGSWLDFSDSANLGDDKSGNTNDWTETNFATTNRTLDRPEDNYCIWDHNTGNPSINVRQGGFSARNGGSLWATICGSFLMKTGKWYWEIDVGSDTLYLRTGIGDMGLNVGAWVELTNNQVGAQTTSWAIDGRSGSGALEKYTNASGTTTDLAELAADDILQVAFDADANKIWFGKNNTWADSGAPASGTGAAYDNTDGIDAALYDYAPVVSLYAHAVSRTDFGQDGFTYTPPTGFLALRSSNLTAPTVLEPKTVYCDVARYTGTGAEQGITDFSFQPDFVFIKNETTTDPYHVYDADRGATKRVEFDVATEEQTNAQGLTSFDSSGFTVGTDNEVNTNTEAYTGFGLKENASYGFDIVTYEGTGAAHTESHSLGAVPKMIWVKNLSQADSWALYHYGGYAGGIADPETDYGSVDAAATWADLDTIWNDTAPTSTVFSVGTSDLVNASGENYVAYLFTDVAGLTRCFRYKGNGSIAGPVGINIGFNPMAMILGPTDSTAGMYFFSKEHDPWNTRGINTKNYFLLTTAAAMGNTNAFQWRSNGFAINTNSSFINGNNLGYVGVAFAQFPFNYSNGA